MTDLSAMSDADLAQIAGVTLPADPVSVRNNNPGNMKSGGAVASFDTPQAGLSAMQHDLMLKLSGQSPIMKSKYGEGYQPTLRNVISTWAPPEENNTDNYIKFVSANTGIDPDAALTPDDTQKIMEPMVHMEGGQKASSHFGKLMKGLGDAAAPPAEAAQTNDLSSMSDEDLMKIAGVQPEGLLSKIGGSGFGQVVGSGIDAATDILGNIVGMVNGKPYQETAPTPDLDALRSKGWSGTTTPQKVGAVEEALFNSPPGKLLQMAGVSNLPGAVAGTGIGAANQAAEKLGVPHQYSTAAEMALPFLGKALPKGDVGTNLPGILGDTASGGEPPPPPPPPGSPQPLPKGVPVGLAKTDSGQPILGVTPKVVKQAGGDLMPYLKADGLDLNKVADELESAQKINPNVRAIDVIAKGEGDIPGGQNVLGLAKSIARQPGQGRTLAAEMTNRGYSASDRIGQAFDQGLSKSDFYSTADAFGKQMKDASAAYTKAYGNPTPITSPAIAKELVKPAAQAALGKAADLASNETGVQITNNGNLTTQGVDYMKRALDDMIETRKRQGENNEVRILTGIKNNIVGEADKLNPDYAAARKAYGDPASANAALEQGRGFMNMDAEEIAKFMKDPSTSQTEKMAFATGARRALQDVIDKKSDTNNPVNSLWKPSLQKRLRAMLPDKASYDAFASNMEHEKTMARVNNKLQGNSDTYESQQFDKKPIESPAGKALRFVGNAMEPGMYVGKLGDFLDKKLAENANQMSQNSKTVIMRYLTTKDPQLLRDLAKQ